MAIGNRNKIDVLARVSYPHSLGVFYTAVTQFLGFPITATSSRSWVSRRMESPDHVDELRKLVTLKPGGMFELNRPYFRHWDEGVEMEWEGGSPTMGRLYTRELEQLLGPVAKA